MKNITKKALIAAVLTACSLTAFSTKGNADTIHSVNNELFETADESLSGTYYYGENKEAVCEIEYINGVLRIENNCSGNTCSIEYSNISDEIAEIVVDEIRSDLSIREFEFLPINKYVTFYCRNIFDENSNFYESYMVLYDGSISYSVSTDTLDENGDVVLSETKSYSNGEIDAESVVKYEKEYDKEGNVVYYISYSHIVNVVDGVKYTNDIYERCDTEGNVYSVTQSYEDDEFVGEFVEYYGF